MTTLEGSSDEASRATGTRTSKQSDREAARATGRRHGGIGAIHQLVQSVGLAERIDEELCVLKQPKPYLDSDHVLNIAYNLLCGGRVLEDIEVRRNDVVFLDALGARAIPDLTTAGDYCRRFDEGAIWRLMDIINDLRAAIWRKQPASFTSATARIDADGTFVPTSGECKEGMDMSYKGVWGYCHEVSRPGKMTFLILGRAVAPHPSAMITSPESLTATTSRGKLSSDCVARRSLP